MSPKQRTVRNHAEYVLQLRESISFYKDQINREILRRQRGISGAGMKSLAIDKAIDRLQRLDDRLKEALKQAEKGSFENYMKIADWQEANERQLNQLKKSQRRRVNVYEFSYELLDAIKQRVTLVDMVDELKIRKKRSGGGRYVIICPFHDEDTPSCMIYVNQDKFHCFGCQANGDVVDFYQKYLDLEFDEAITRLVERLGIQIMDAEAVENSDKIIAIYKEALADIEEELKRENIRFAQQLKGVRYANNH